MPEPGFTRRSSYERELQPVAIISVDPISRTAIGVTRTRHSLNINCAYATGDTITIPASGEQWYCERFDNEWRLYGRIPFNDPTLNITPEEGQVSVGSASGPLELNGTEVRANGKVFRLNGVYYRDSGVALERSTDQITWQPIITAAAGLGGLVPMIAKALTGFDGTDQDLALLSLENWAEILGVIIENFSTFWNELCQNVFVNGLKRMGFGDTDLSKIVDGFQNFIDYLFSVIFCDFDGNLTPQTVLARIRDLLAPIIGNPFVQGLKAIGDILGVTVGNLLNDAVAGATSLIELIFNIITCNWAAVTEALTTAYERVTGQEAGETSWLTVLAQLLGLADDENVPFGPANIVKSIFNTFQFLGSPTINGVPNPVGLFFIGLQSFFGVLFESTGSLFEDVLGGLVEFINLVFGILTCDADALVKATEIIDAIVPGEGSIFDQIISVLFGVLTPLTQVEIAGVPNPVAIFLTGLRDLYEQITGNTATNLADGAIGGAVEFVRLIFRVITCSDTNVLADLTSLVDSFASGYDDPFGILKFLGDLFTSILSNPLVIAIQDFLVGFFPDLAGTSLIQQLIDGSTNLVNWLLKIVTLILPFDELWRDTLLPFIDWDAVDAVEVVLPDITLIPGLENGFADLWKVIFKPINLIIQGIIPAAGDSAFTDFITNITNFFAPIGEFFADPESFLNDIAQGLDGTIIPELLKNVLWIATDVDGVLQFIGDLVPSVGDFLANLLELFGVDFGVDAESFNANLPAALATVAGKILGGLTDNLFAIFGIDLTAEDLNPVTALTTIAGKVIEGLFDIPAAFFTNIITNLTNLFGGQAAFEGGSFNLVTAATYFVNNVLNQAATALQSLVEGVGSLVYNIAKAIIEVIGKIPLVGAPVAATLTALLEGFVNFGRGTVASGSNLLVDPGAEYASFWTQADATRDTNVKRSAGASLRVTSGGSTARTVWFNVNDLGEVVPILSGTGEVNYAECYVLYPTTYTVSGVPTANAGTSGTVTLVAQFTNSLGEASPASTEQTITTFISGKNNTNWIKLGGNFTTPTPTTGFYDRVSLGFRLAANQTTSGARFYVDDMLVREISAAKSAADDVAATNTALFNNPARPSAGTKVPATNVGSNFGNASLGTDLTNINNTATNAVGAAGTAQGTANTATTRANYANLNLFGNVDGGNNGKVLKTALPPELGAVGSGVFLRKRSGSYTTQSTAAGWMLEDSFYTAPAVQTTPDLAVESVSGKIRVRATVEGWYLVEMAYGITRALEMYQFYFNPVLYKNGAVYKFGGGISNAAYYRQDGFVTLSLSVVPEMCQSSFIVYLGVNETVSPGYVWHPDPQDSRGSALTTDTIIVADSSGYFNYFSMGLLNRSLA